MSAYKQSEQNKYSEQVMGNFSFDEDYNVNAIEIVAEDTANAILRKLQSDSSGFLKVSLGTDIAGEDSVNEKLVVEQRYTNFNIVTATTTIVKAGAGYVDEIIVVGGALGDVTIYDNTAASGTKLCPTITPVSGAIILKHITFATGLTIVTAAATGLVGSYR